MRCSYIAICCLAEHRTLHHTTWHHAVSIASTTSYCICLDSVLSYGAVTYMYSVCHELLGTSAALQPAPRLRMSFFVISPWVSHSVTLVEIWAFQRAFWKSSSSAIARWVLHCDCIISIMKPVLKCFTKWTKGPSHTRCNMVKWFLRIVQLCSLATLSMVPNLVSGWPRVTWFKGGLLWSATNHLINQGRSLKIHRHTGPFFDLIRDIAGILPRVWSWWRPNWSSTRHKKRI